MSETNWTGFPGDWSDSFYWTNGVPDSASVTAVIAGGNSFVLGLAAGETYASGSVTLDDSGAVFNLNGTLTVVDAFTLSSGVLNLAGTLDGGALDNTGGSVNLDGGTLDGVDLTGSAAVGGTASMDGGGNAGTVVVGNGDTLTLAGSMANGGEIGLTAGGFGATLSASGTVILGGGGTVFLSDAGGTANEIIGNTLVNADNTISGAGQIGAGTLTFTNQSQGVVDADTGNRLYLNTTGTVTNTGLLEDTGTGGLWIQSTVTGGTVAAVVAGSAVVLNGATLIGVTETTANGGVISVAVGATLVDPVLDGTVVVGNGDALTLSGSITNGGEIELTAGGFGATLSASGTVTLGSGGTVFLSNAGGTANEIIGNTLVNIDDTISGAGQIGAGTLSFTNQSQGVVDADTGNALYLDTTGTVTNTGLLEDTGTGGLFIEGVVANAGGTLGAYGGGGVVDLDLARIAGGTLTAGGGGFFNVAGGSATLDGSAGAVTLGGYLLVGNGETLGLLGTIDNQATIALRAGGFGAGLSLGTGIVVLDGGGTVFLSDAGGTANAVYGTGTLDNLDNLILGAGQIGDSQSLSIVNAGTIDASTGNQLTIDTTGTVTNTGLLEDTGTGGLWIQSTVTGGTVAAVVAGSAVVLNGATLIGVTETTANGGVISVAVGATLVDPVLDGTVVVGNGDALTLSGSITNGGEIELTAGGFGATLSASGTVTLGSGGTVFLSNAGGTANEIIGNTLVNIDDTISGAGQIGAGTLSFTNQSQGVVDADTGNALYLDTIGTVTNTGLLEDTGTGGLFIEGVVANAGGTLGAYGGGGVVDLDLARIAGGTLTAGGGGFFNVAGGSATLDGSAGAVTLGGYLLVGNGETLGLLGTIDNQATIALRAGGFGAGLSLGTGIVVLDGGGTVFLSDAGGTANAVYGTGTLDNLDNLILGAGQIGDSQSLSIVNAGTIDASTGNQLTIDTTGTVTNTGLLEDTGTGGLWIQSTVTGGTVAAVVAGSAVVLNGATLIGVTETTANGGVISVAVGATLVDPVLDGTVVVGNGDALTLSGSITNGGEIELTAGGFGATLSASGTVTLGSGGTVFLSNAGGTANEIIGNTLVNIDDTISGAGQIGAGTLSFTNQSQGVVDADTGNALYLDTTGTVTNTGLLEDTGTGGLFIEGVVANAGGTLGAYGGGGVVDLDLARIAGGTLTAGGGGFFNVAGGSATLDGSAGAVTLGGYLLVGNGETLGLLGTIDNQATIALRAGGFGAGLSLGTGIVVLDGGGTVFLSDAGGTANAVYGTGTLDNLDNLILGAGQIGDSQSLSIVNAGTIDASTGNQLTIDTTGTVTNTGLLEDTGTGGLWIQSTVTGGTVAAVVAGSAVVLNGATLIGVTETTANGGVISVAVGATLVDPVLDGTVVVGNGDALTLSGSITNGGEIELTAGGFGATLSASGTVILGGGGTVFLSNAGGTANEIIGNTLVNADNTISGAGQIGAGTLSFTNQSQGVVDADTGNALYLDTGGTVTNTGLLEDTGTGGLWIQSAVAGGTIGAYGGGAFVALEGGLLSGGTLQTSGGGSDLILSNFTFDGSSQSIANLGQLTIEPRVTLTILGSVSNAGGMTVNGFLDDTGSFANTGTIAASGIGIYLGAGGTFDNAAAFTAGGTAVTVTGSGVVTNGANGTISGTAGIIFQAAAVGTVLNAGTIESTAGTAGIAVQFGTENDLLRLGADGVFIGTVDGGGGANTLELTSVSGPGTLNGLGTGYFGFTDFTLLTVDTDAAWTLTGAATLQVGYTMTNYGILTVADGLTNDGLLTTPGYLEVTGGSLSNAGTILDTGGLGRGVDFLAAATLTNQGYIGASSIGVFLRSGGSLYNGGSIQASGSNGVGAYLYAGGTVTNNGMIEGGAAGAYLHGGSLANYRSIVASGAGGIGVAVSNGGTLVNAAGAVISGAIGVELLGNAATLVNGGEIDGAGGYAVVLGGKNDLLTWQIGASVTGKIAGGGGTLDLAAGIDQEEEGGTLTGLGTYFSHFSLIDIDADADWTLAGAGTLTAAYSIDVAGTLSVTGTLKDDGAISVTGSLIDDGLITIAHGNTLSDASALYGSGTIDLSDFSVLELSQGASGGTIDFTDGTGILSLADASYFDDQITGFLHGDTIDLTGIAYSASDTISYSGGYATLYADSEAVAHLALSGVPTGATLALQSDLHGGTDIVDPVEVTPSGTYSGYDATPITLSSAYAAVTVTASGTIDAASAYGVTVENAAGTVTDFGTIEGMDGAVRFTSGAYADRVIDEVGAVFIGAVRGGGADSVLELASGGGAGTIAGLGSQFIDFGTVEIDSGAEWDASGSNTVAGLTNDGTLTLEAGAFLDIAGALSGAGTIEVKDGALDLGVNVASANLAFTGAGGLIELTQGGTYTGVSVHIHAGDTIVLASQIWAQGDKAVFANGKIKLKNSSGATLDSVAATEGANVTGFKVVDDGGKTVIEALPLPPAGVAAIAINGDAGALFDSTPSGSHSIAGHHAGQLELALSIGNADRL